MATQLQALDQDKLHFFAELKKLMECPTFLPSGEHLELMKWDMLMIVPGRWRPRLQLHACIPAHI